tara:strand:- start:1490 stop:1612 length:123 start_codon:yes stop_codon:yes gene_type:complete
MLIKQKAKNISKINYQINIIKSKNAFFDTLTYGVDKAKLN